MSGKKKNIHVTANPNGGWDIKRENAERASKHVDTKVEAEQIARDMGRKSQVEVIIHDKKGRIQKRNSYGNDPYPPEG